VTYFHTQRAPMYLIVVAGAMVFLSLAAVLPAPLADRIVRAVISVLLLPLAWCFKTLTVRDEGTHLAVRFGPLPVFRKRIAYAGMTDARRSRSKFVDGWGIHGVVGRGWTYNLWGFDCVEIRLGPKIVRVGTDDPDGLAQFLKAKIQSKQ
jgi:hypothetical protein